MIIALYDVELCSCCLIWLANNDRSGCDDTCDPADHPSGLMGHLVLRAGEVCVPGSGEPSFSWSSCDGCGSRLGGDRTTATVLGPDTPSDDPDLHMACIHGTPKGGGFCTETPDGVPVP